MALRTAEAALMRAVENFPRWMSIRKRPHTSKGGLYLKAILDEETSIKEELDDYIKSFFLLSYVGREDTLIDYAYVAQIGDVSKDLFESDQIAITTDARVFLKERPQYALYQDEYIVICPEAVPENKMFSFSVNGFSYSVKLTQTHIWNVIDEFAMMSGIERYEGETNHELMIRCFSAFRNPTNSTELGIKHTIENAVENFLPIEDKDIRIEVPNEENLNLSDDEYGTVYERLAQFNEDIFRTKEWDMATWEHNFAKIGFIPNKWDAPIEVYQDGVGQMDDLHVSLSDQSSDATTDIEVTGYEASRVMIDNYVRRHNIKRDIPLKLSRYNDELKSKKVGYRIIASEVQKINPSSIYLRCATKVSGQGRHYLSDIITDKGELTNSTGGLLDKGSTYTLTFLPKSEYSAMAIYHADILKDQKRTHLLKEDRIFKFRNGVLYNSNVAVNATTLDQLKDYKNITATADGFTIGGASATGELVLDVTGMDNKRINLPAYCQMVNITQDPVEVKGNGFILNELGDWVSQGDQPYSTLTIDLKCNEVAFQIPEEEDPSKQGSYIITVQSGGKIIESRKAAQPIDYDRQFDGLTDIHIEIQKLGDMPVVVRNIMASSYEIKCWTDVGTVVRTPHAMTLPDVGGKKNALHVSMTMYRNYAPVLSCIHIGASVAAATYTISGIKADAAENALDIASDCIVELYKETDDGLELVTEDYSTQSTYTNNTDHDVYAEIDTSNFLEIRSASMAIQSTTKNGRIVNYITFMPGDSYADIIIDGTSYVVKERKNLSNLLEVQLDDSVYVSSGIEGFIVIRKSGQEEIRKIERDQIVPSADSFAYEGTMPDGVSACFVADAQNGVVTHTPTFERNFECTYLAVSGGQQYIAYNEESMYQKELDGVKIVNTFAPLLNMNKLLFFRIDKGLDKTFDVSFIKTWGGHTEYADWSFGQKKEGMRIRAYFDFNNEAEYKLDANQVTESFAISNNIALHDTYTINGEDTPLGRYIITPPDDMQIIYETATNDGQDSRQSGFYAKEDLFNKLYHSNVSRILMVLDTDTQKEIPASDYALMSEPGILVWKTNQYADHYILIAYEYKKPKYLAYKDLSSLYEIIGYSTDAYKKINSEPILVEGLKSGESRSINFGGKKPDKIIVTCTNPNFQAAVSGSTVRVNQIGSDGSALVHTGYYYDDGEEYYLFKAKRTEDIDRMNNIEMHFVRHIGDTLSMIQASSNFIRDTAMGVGDRQDILCNFDGQEPENTKGISTLDSLTACDSYGKWKTFRMDVNLVDGYNGLGLSFSGKDDGYAILDITDVVKNNCTVSMKKDDSLNVQVCEEIHPDDDRFRRSVFARPIASVSEKNGFSVYHFTNVKPEYRYYLYVTGTGMLDDIIAADNAVYASVNNLHRKNLNALGFSFDEHVEKGYEHSFVFDPAGVVTDGLEVNNAGVITTGSNVDWGLTRIYSMQEAPHSCTYENLLFLHDAFYSKSQDGTVTTPIIFLPNKASILSLYVKVNDVVTDPFSDFDIHILTASSENELFREVAADEQVNLATVSATRLSSYVKATITMPKGRVINNIEIYVRYAETDDGALHIVRNTYGTLQSKVYDATYAANLQPVRIEGTVNDPSNIRLFVRALKEEGEQDQWTIWYECDIDPDLTIRDGHVFNGYRHYQFELAMYGEDTTASLQDIVCKVVE